MMKEEKQKNLTLFLKNFLVTALIFAIGSLALYALQRAGIQIRLLRNFILFVIVLAVLIFVEMGIFGILARYLRAASALRNLEKGFDPNTDYIRLLETPAEKKAAKAAEAAAEEGALAVEEAEKTPSQSEETLS